MAFPWATSDALPGMSGSSAALMIAAADANAVIRPCLPNTHEGGLYGCVHTPTAYRGLCPIFIAAQTRTGRVAVGISVRVPDTRRRSARAHRAA